MLACCNTIIIPEINNQLTMQVVLDIYLLYLIFNIYQGKINYESKG